MRRVRFASRRSTSSCIGERRLYINTTNNRLVITWKKIVEVSVPSGPSADGGQVVQQTKNVFEQLVHPLGGAAFLALLLTCECGVRDAPG